MDNDQEIPLFLSQNANIKVQILKGVSGLETSFFMDDILGNIFSSQKLKLIELIYIKNKK